MNQLKISQCVTARTMTVDSYLRDVNRLPMVSPEEEAQLAARIQDGDVDALSNYSGLVTFGVENGFVNNEKLSLSDEVKSTFFDEIELAPEKKVNHKNIIQWETIKEQELFYNAREEENVRRLENLLQEDNFKAARERLESQGMPKGFSCIFHGCAGSGKTATLKAHARKSVVDFVLNGTHADLDTLRKYCSQENVSGKSGHAKIGFAAN